jgi:magnesium chelatase family protein
LRDEPSAEASAFVRERVGRARSTQIARQGSPNSMLSGRSLREVCALRGDAEALFSRAVDTMGLSGRGHDRVLRVARTVADLAKEDEIGAEHVAEALNYRRSHLVGR